MVRRTAIVVAVTDRTALRTPWPKETSSPDWNLAPLIVAVVTSASFTRAIDRPEIVGPAAAARAPPESAPAAVSGVPARAHAATSTGAAAEERMGFMRRPRALVAWRSPGRRRRPLRAVRPPRPRAWSLDASPTQALLRREVSQITPLMRRGPQPAVTCSVVTTTSRRLRRCRGGAIVFGRDEVARCARFVESTH